MKLTNLPGTRWDAGNEDWAAELTMAAYLVVLRDAAPRNWLDLQLDLWRALTATMGRGDGTASIPFPAEDQLAELAYVAYRIVLPYGARRSFLDLELELYQTFRRATESAERRWAAPRACVAG